MATILEIIQGHLPRGVVSSTIFEGANIVVYTTDTSFFKNGDSKIKEAVNLVKKRIELRADKKLLMDKEETIKKIKEIIPEEAEITDIIFDPQRSTIIIDAKKPGLAIGKGASLLKEIKAATLILDGCAAPGSKTTQIAALNQKGLIVANELEYTRIRALKHNTEKTGCLNIQTTNLNFLRLPNDYEYDVILLDAPCSGEGTCRKNPKIFLSWKEKDYKSYSGIQKQLIMKAYNLLKEGGTLIYSTCTFAPEENERVINHLLENTTAKIQEIKIKNLKS
ncbi:KH domain-containing protein, partial [archaeon]|nr:KH domain-containing protein [archaeon]